MYKFLFTVSLVLNITLVGYWAVKRIYYAPEPRRYEGYLNNYQYQEQTAIFPAYRSSCRLAILGDSHAYKCHWDELLGFPVCNRGIGSDVTQGMYNRVWDILNVKPEVCLIESGANDVWYNIHPDTTIRYVKLIIDTLKKHNIRPLVMEATHESDSAVNKKYDTLNMKLRELGVQTIGIDVTKEDLQPDGVHLKASAYLKWREKILEIIH